MPKVSIIIPAFNAEKTIAYTINSVLAQTYSEFEVIVINDGSTDRTLEELIYLESQDSRIKLLNQKNMGVSAARNKGIKYSTGKYLMFLDADDFLDKMAIESLVSCIEKEKVDCVSTNYKIISKKTKYIDVIEYSEKLSFKEMKDKLYPVLLCDNSLVDTYHKGLWTKLYRSKIIKDNQINFCTDLQIYEDTLFVMEYLTNCHSIINLADIYFYNYVNNNSSVTNNYVSNCWLTLKLSAERAKKIRNKHKKY